MATDIAGLFGITPQGLSQQRYQQDLKQGYELAQLDPGAAARATLQSGVGQLGRGIAGMMGVEDPQMKLISARQSVIGQLDQTDPASLLKGAQMLPRWAINKVHLHWQTMPVKHKSKLLNNNSVWQWVKHL
jgi:hypothetical protein